MSALLSFQVRYTKFSDLVYPLYFSIAVFLVKFTLEKNLFRV